MPDTAVQSLGRHLSASQRLAQSALVEARQAITSLRTNTIGWDEFVEGLETFCEETAQNLDLHIDIHPLRHHPGLPTTVHAQLQTDVLRLLNETFSNAVRHGHATRIDVELRVLPATDRLIIRIRDDGRGFVRPVATLDDEGIGLRSMAERLERRAGSLSVESGGTGTVIRAELPLGRFALL
jgi:signal transduction histidine kinase